jgi:hypothetical protein
LADAAFALALAFGASSSSSSSSAAAFLAGVYERWRTRGRGSQRLPQNEREIVRDASMQTSKLVR